MMFIFMPIQILFVTFSTFYWIDFQVMLKYQGDDISIPFRTMIIAVNINFIFLLFELFFIILFFYRKWLTNLLILFLLIKIFIFTVVIYYFYTEQLNLHVYSWLFLIGSAVSTMLYFSVKNKKSKK